MLRKKARRDHVGLSSFLLKNRGYTIKGQLIVAPLHEAYKHAAGYASAVMGTGASCITIRETIDELADVLSLGL